MGADKNTESSYRLTDSDSGNNSIRELLNKLQGEGEYLIFQIPSNIDDNFILELENDVNTLYGELYKLLNSPQITISKKVIQELMNLVSKKILPSISSWNKYASKYPGGDRPSKLYEPLKEVGVMLAELHQKI